MEATEKVVGKLEGEIIGIRQELATLNKILLELHLKDDKVHTFKGIFLKKEIIGYFILFIIGITSLLPRDVNLWELIKNLLF